jgi:2-amino-4-hydroxy-6-hydroxymethyldihydropteridine diphosphokinase
MTTKSSPSARPRPSKGRKTAKTTTRKSVAPPRLVFVAIGLGSNLGERREILRRVRGTLAAQLEGVRCSPFYETSPVGGPPDQPDYLNAVIIGRTSLSAPSLFTFLRKSESTAGRKRAREARNGPRLLDLDLLLYGTERIATRRLTVPHPRMASRLFVLAPLADVAPRRVVPGTGKTVARLLREARLVSKERIRRAR